MSKKFISIEVLVTLFFSLSVVLHVHSQPPIQWKKSIGGSFDDYVEQIHQTEDGGFIIGGWTESEDGDVSQHLGSYDIWLVKLSEEGAILWERTYGGDRTQDFLNDLVLTEDGGFLAVGSKRIDPRYSYGILFDADCLLVKTDAAGNVEWEREYDFDEDDFVTSAIQTIDGGYIFTASIGSVFLSNRGLVGDVYVVKIDQLGEIEWQNRLGGANDDFAKAIIQTEDQGYLIAATSRSSDGDVGENLGDADTWVIKLNSSGVLEWKNIYGGTQREDVRDLIELSDGNFIVGGTSSSKSGDVNSLQLRDDFWVLKISPTGDIVWSKSYGGSRNDSMGSIVQAEDQGFSMIGTSSSTDGDNTNDRQNQQEDLWVLKIDELGNIEWQESLGGSDIDFGESIIHTSDGYFIAGNVRSEDGDIDDMHGIDFTNIWVLKLGDIVTSSQDNLDLDDIAVSPNPVLDILNLSVSQKWKASKYYIYNDIGQLVQTGELTNAVTQYDVSKLQPGAYLLNIVRPQSQINFSFIKL